MQVLDLCMHGLIACDEEGPGLVNLSVAASSPLHGMRACERERNAWVNIDTCMLVRTT